MFYLDDGTIGGSLEDLEHDVEVLVGGGAEIGLQLNTKKSEIVCPNTDLLFSLPSLLGSRVVDPTKATLLGSPIGSVLSISDTLIGKTDLLRRLGDRLQDLSAHDALLLLKHSFALPKLLYYLRTAPCFLSPVIQEYDELLKSIVSGITNVHFGEVCPSWIQASLPVKLGGLGIKSAVHLAPCAYLASTSASADLVQCILPPPVCDIPLPHREEAETRWSEGHDQPPPEGVAQKYQKSWNIKASAVANTLLENVPDSGARARLLASSVRVWSVVECLSDINSGPSHGRRYYWRLGYVWVPLCVDLTHAFIVGAMLTPRGLMVLVVGTARVATFAMLL